MFRTIVVPLDGSPFAAQALPVALGLARAAGASLRLVSVHVPIVSPELVPGVPALDTRLEREAVAAEERALAETATRLRTRWKLDVSAQVRVGRPAAAIAAYAREVGADLLVLTTHGRGGLSRLWLGSVADELLRAAEIPVLAARPARGGAGGERPRRVRHVLVSLDGSELAQRVLDAAVVVARLATARLTLLQVITPHLGIARPAPVTRLDRADLHRQRAAAERHLADVARRRQGEGVRMGVRVVTAADVANAIIRSARGLRVDLIAMTTHARGRVERLFRGSGCDKVVRGATGTAVLVVRPREAEGPGGPPASG